MIKHKATKPLTNLQQKAHNIHANGHAVIPNYCKEGAGGPKWLPVKYGNGETYSPELIFADHDQFSVRLDRMVLIDYDGNKKTGIPTIQTLFANLFGNDKLFDHQHSGGGLTHFKRYWLANRGEARKVAELVNLKRKQRRAAPISRKQIALYAGLFTAEPKAEANTNDRLAAILSTYAIDKYDVEIMPVVDIGQKGYELVNFCCAAARLGGVVDELKKEPTGKRKTVAALSEVAGEDFGEATDLLDASYTARAGYNHASHRLQPARRKSQNIKEVDEHTKAELAIIADACDASRRMNSRKKEKRRLADEQESSKGVAQLVFDGMGFAAAKARAFITAHGKGG